MISRISGLVATSGDRSLIGASAERMRRALTAAATVSEARAGSALLLWAGRPEVAGSLHRDGIAVVLDGYIYNRDVLGAAPDASDAAVVLALYQRYGFAEAVSRINGDFAIALYDERTATLFLGRDRFGVRPLYWTALSEGVAFASRPRTLLALPDVDPSPDRRFVALYAASHYRVCDNDPERSAYAAIRQVPAGTVLEVSATGRRSIRYWSLHDQSDVDADEPALADELRRLLLLAVARRMRRAQRPAFMLSGGLDSSSVLACAHHLNGERQDAFSSVYADKTYDESDEIRSMLAHVRRWNAVSADEPDIMSTVSRMVEAHDQPVVTATWLAHFELCAKAASSGFGAIFGGLGGDELNAGEYEYFFFHFADLRAHQPATLQREIAEWMRHHDHPIFRKSPEFAEATLARVVDASVPGRCRPDRQRIERYAKALNRDYFAIRDFVPEMDTVFTSYLKNRTFHDLFRETMPPCLRAEDRHSDAFGIDHFDPFLDVDLVEFMFRVPGSMKIRNGITKHLLRRAMTGILPDETRTRIKKMGWNAPAHLWFSGRGLDAVRDLVASRSFRGRGIYHPPEVERLIDEHQAIIASGELRENHMMFLWQLVNLELWLQRLASGTPPE